MSADPDDGSGGAPGACRGGAITVSESTASAISTENPFPASTAAMPMRTISRAAETRDTLTGLQLDKVFMFVLGRENVRYCTRVIGSQYRGASRPALWKVTGGMWQKNGISRVSTECALLWV